MLEEAAQVGGRINGAVRPSCLFVNTYYQAFLQNQYLTGETRADSGYQEQLSSLTAECFGDSDFYSRRLREAGFQTEDTIINCDPLQDAWARENGFQGSGIVVALEQIVRMQPDIAYFQDMHMMSAEFLTAIRPHVKFIVGQIASPMHHIPLSCYDIIFSSFPHFTERFRAKGISAYYQPLAFEERVLQTFRTKSFEQRTVELSFIGGVTPDHSGRYQLLETLANATPLEVWGYGAEALPSDSPLTARHRGQVWGKDMFARLADSKITINKHIDVAENNANNMRLFEATGCGALLITDYKDNISDLFEIGREVVCYRDAEECLELVNYYLSNPEEAKQIAARGQERTLREHSYQKRMFQTAEILERHLRYHSEQGLYQVPDISAISTGYTDIAEHAVDESLTMAWTDKSLPARQRALVQQELGDLHHGRAPLVFSSLANLVHPYLEPGASVLEIGCASGYYYEALEFLLKKRISYTGVDYSESMIAMASDYYPDTNFRVADGASLPFTDQAFFLSISSCILLHVPNYEEHIAETVRVTERFVVVHRTPVCRTRETQFQKKLAYGIETVELRFSEAEIVSCFLQNGLELLQMIELDSNEQADQYTVSYLFQRLES